MAFVPQDRPRLGRLAGVCEAYLIAAAEADLAPSVAEPVAIEVRAGACLADFEIQPRHAGDLMHANRHVDRLQCSGNRLRLHSCPSLASIPPAHPQMDCYRAIYDVKRRYVQGWN